VYHNWFTSLRFSLSLFKGIDIDDDYHWLSSQEQEKIETEFKEEESDECKKHRLSIDDGE
jgi:hypothetical protein